MDTWFYRNPRGFAVAVLVIIAMGWSAFLTIGRQEDPTITNLFATVLTPYPGADPARVEALVTEKIEAELRGVAAISEISSVSRTGLSVIQIDLSETLPKSEIEPAWTEIRNAVDDASAELPAGAGAPDFENASFGTFTAISSVMQRSGDAPNPVLLARSSEELQQRLRRVPGTDTVEIFGAPKEEILVSIDATRLTDLGLDAARVSAAIAAADAKVSAGRLQGGEQEMVVEIAGEIDDLARIRAIPLATGADGAVLRLGDVADVTRTPLEPADSVARYQGRPAVLVAARMVNDLQVDRWMDVVRAELADFEAVSPGGIEDALIFDQSTYVTERFAALGANLAAGIGLVTLVLFVTLGWRAALIVASAIPLAALISLFGMNLAGISIHQMSVTGLIVALGLLVDAAIVMTDEIRKRLADGAPRLDAVRRAVRMLAVPLLASTLTTVLAFMPMALLPGPVGDFVGSIAKSVIIMLVASLALALTLTPALAGWLLPAGGDRPRRWWRDGLVLPRLARVFDRSLALSLRHLGLAILASLALPVAGFLAFPTLTAQFFPGADRNQFYVQLTLSGTASISQTEAAATRADRLLRATPGIETVAWTVGESAPSFYYNMQMDQDGVSGFAEALVTTDSAKRTLAVIPELQDRLTNALPDAVIVVRDLVQGPPVAAPIEVRFVGSDLAVLRDLGDRTRALMAGVPGITQSRATLTSGPPKLRLALDEDRVRLAGLDLASVAAQLSAATDGALGGSLVEGTEESPVRVRLAEGDRAAPERLASLAIVDQAADAGRAWPGVPLAALGDLELIPSDSPIQRRNGERINLVQAFTAIGVLPEEALSVLRARLDAEPDLLPPGYRLEYGGDADARSDTVSHLMATVLMVVVLTLATLVLSFRSFRLTAISLAVAGLSMGLSLLSLAIFDYPFGIQGLLGAIGSIGVSINAAIIILSALAEEPRARAGDRDAVRTVVLGTSRHILSTTITTFGGFLPLILAGGGFWPPFAMAVAGGVLLSTVVAFYFTPPMFALFYGRREVAGASGRHASEALPGLGAGA
jgi:multidrug efflux pump subunit AcrB